MRTFFERWKGKSVLSLVVYSSIIISFKDSNKKYGDERMKMLSMRGSNV